MPTHADEERAPGPKRDGLRTTLIPHRPGNLRYVGQETKAVAKREHSKRNIRDSHPADVLDLANSRGRHIRVVRTKQRERAADPIPVFAILTVVSGLTSDQGLAQIESMGCLTML